MARKKEDASDQQYEAAIKLLEEGGTKKAATELLGCSYSNLQSKIDKWLSEQETKAKMKASKRGTTIKGTELANIIEAYLSGDSIDEISSRTYRSTMLVKATLEKEGALLRVQERVEPTDEPLDIPEILMSNTFMDKELVWVPRYQCIGEITKKLSDEVYRVYLLDSGKQRYIHEQVWDLASMQHFSNLGVNVKGLIPDLIISGEDAEDLVKKAKNLAIANKRKDND